MGFLRFYDLSRDLPCDLPAMCPIYNGTNQHFDLGFLLYSILLFIFIIIIIIIINFIIIS